VTLSDRSCDPVAGTLPDAVTDPVTDPGALDATAGVRLLPVRYDDPVVRVLVEEVQQVYVERYGGRDDTPMTPEQFAPPHGRFFLAYLDGQPAAIGGWRLRTDAGAGLPGTRPAEVKRMFVRAAVRGRGLARAVLGTLESSARADGVDWLVLETGDRQPEAVSLYRSAGYTEVTRFGLYAHEQGSIYIGKRL
jgi:GNAT superfamily N-acetyltransferase